MLWLNRQVESHSVNSAIQYYTCPSEVTEAREYAGEFDRLPRDVLVLSQVIQGLLIHILEAQRYGLDLPEKRKQEIRIGRVAGMLRRILELDARPLHLPRPPDRRLVATCHDYSALLCAMLRHQGTAVRARSGFAAYLLPGKYVDHWACEYWEPVEGRRVMVDAQLDDVLRAAYQIAFDPCDVPAGQFLTAGRAWQLCRSRQADPDRFGFSRWWGLAYLRHNLLRDLLALNKLELLPWEPSGLPEREERDVPERDRVKLDRIARLSLDGNEAFAELRAVYHEVVERAAPADWSPWQPDHVRGDRGMIPPSHLDVLRTISARLGTGGVNWALTGSLGVALQGVPVEVHDIDLQTDEAGAYEIERLLVEYAHKKVALSCTDRIRSHFGALCIDGIQVEVMGDVQKRCADGSWENAPDLPRHKRVVRVGSMQVPVMSLEYERQAYRKLGRMEKAEILEEWLAGRQAGGGESSG